MRITCIGCCGKAELSRAVRLVLDTNVALDWLVFADPGVVHIVAALHAGRATAWTNAACEAEFARVLGYARFGVSGPAQEAALRAYRALVQHHAAASDPSALPRCADADDQKFLELARDVGASHLVTKDKSLLALGRARYGLRFRVVPPHRLLLTN